MGDLFNQLLPIFAVVSASALGIFAIIGVFDRVKRERVKESDVLDDRIKSLYKEQIDAQEKKIKDLSIEISGLKERSSTLEGQNLIFKDLITGRDKDTVAWRERTEKTMDMATDMSKVIFENGKKTDTILQAINQTTKNVERLALAIEKHLK